MHDETIERLGYTHDSALAVERGEQRTRWVVVLTASMMVAELIAGSLTNSLALLADGWHMATHAGALGLASLAYWFARSRARHSAFTFGTGKVYALAGYTSAVGLGFVACWMLAQSASRLIHPLPIAFGEALPVAVIGLGVNLLSLRLLEHGDRAPIATSRDHNWRAAYLHVMADALTSVLAIAALLSGRYLGWVVVDPLMGIVGAGLILHWGAGLCRDAARQLLDVLPSAEVERALRGRLEATDDVRVADLHLWAMGPGRTACIVSLVSATPRETTHYRNLILSQWPLAHLTVEVHRCPDGHGEVGQPALPGLAYDDIEQ